MGIFNSNVRQSLKEEFIASIKANFNRTVVTSCSRWAEKYRIVKSEKWSFDRFPWLRDMHDSNAQFNIGQKAAQMGYTETVLNIAFYNVDIRQRDVLYALPSLVPDAAEFSASRFDPAVEESDHLTRLFSDVKNIRHKRAANANIYIRGARTRSHLKSIPTGVVILDEVNEMPKENIPLAFERTSGQEEKLIWLISTPSIDEAGISGYYNRSSQNQYYFKCPSCNRYIRMVFPDSIKIIGDGLDDPRLKESYYICTLCEAKLEHKNKISIFKTGKWIEEYANRDDKGWHINHLYSTVISPAEVAKKYFRSLTDTAAEQEFYNSDLGLTHEVEGSRVTDAQIERARGGYIQYQFNENNTLTTLGVDVNYPFIFYEVDEWQLPERAYTSDLNLMAKCKVLKQGKLKDVEHLDGVMRDFKIRYAVIDAQPERRKAYEFATRFWGRVRLAFYGNAMNGKQIHISDDEEPKLTVDRTSWLDMSLGRFKNNTISLPSDVSYEYREHLKAPVRTFRIDKLGNPIGCYESPKSDDFAHARNYAEIALPMAVSLATSYDFKANI